ncbi:uncharacterized protein ARMOST_22080 [Armillaria ostoyae]|uniref:Uncharacterized protein n=1 Tax=Armillaria ostoyae TaxID=47428 RepID=A0A284SBU5_ARMOS|nr:uncharacterized protein ARMOST_22080 [Armillaria ostoyae]
MRICLIISTKIYCQWAAQKFGVLLLVAAVTASIFGLTSGENSKDGADVAAFLCKSLFHWEQRATAGYHYTFVRRDSESLRNGFSVLATDTPYSSNVHDVLGDIYTKSSLGGSWAVRKPTSA